jgi:HD superfamily phosphohydrolase
MSQNCYNKKIVLKDIVHNYIEITYIEKQFIDNPKFQRLRFIGQNSLAYFTFPSNNSTRFLHSLGVMHLGGKMFKKALENSSEHDFTSFIGSAGELVTQTCRNLVLDFDKIQGEWNSVLGNVSGFNFVLNQSVAISQKDYVVINILWQSVRLACLMHDVGHFPISHVWEYAIDNYRKDYDKSASVEQYGTQTKSILEDYKLLQTKYNDIVVDDKNDTIENDGDIQLHEMMGLIQMDKIFGVSSSSEIASISKLCYRIAKDIFIKSKATKAGKGVLGCLYTIISSDVDADRLDYCIRDAVCSGVELGAIDIDRIVNNLRIIYEDDSFRIVLKSNAISAVEEFFHQRYQLYKYIIYHHNVVRYNGVIESILIKLLKEVENPSTPFKELFKNYNFWIDGFKDKDGIKTEWMPKQYDEYEYYDDNWIRTFLYSIYSFIKSDSELAMHYSQLVTLLRTYLFRETKNLYSLGKRETNINFLLSRIKKECGIDDEENIIPKINLAFEKSNRKDSISFLRNLYSEFGVILICSDCKAKILDRDKKTINKQGETVNSDKLLSVIYNNGDGKSLAFDTSAYLRSLQKVVEHTLTPNFSFVFDNIEDNEEIQEKCRDIIVKFFVKIINNN